MGYPTSWRRGPPPSRRSPAPAPDFPDPFVPLGLAGLGAVWWATQQFRSIFGGWRPGFYEYTPGTQPGPAGWTLVLDCGRPRAFSLGSGGFVACGAQPLAGSVVRGGPAGPNALNIFYWNALGARNNALDSYTGCLPAQRWSRTAGQPIALPPRFFPVHPPYLLGGYTPTGARRLEKLTPWHQAGYTAAEPWVPYPARLPIGATPGITIPGPVIGPFPHTPSVPRPGNPPRPVPRVLPRAVPAFGTRELKLGAGSALGRAMIATLAMLSAWGAFNNIAIALWRALPGNERRRRIPAYAAMMETWRRMGELQPAWALWNVQRTLMAHVAFGGAHGAIRTFASSTGQMGELGWRAASSAMFAQEHAAIARARSERELERKARREYNSARW